MAPGAQTKMIAKHRGNFPDRFARPCRRLDLIETRMRGKAITLEFQRNLHQRAGGTPCVAEVPTTLAAAAMATQRMRETNPILLRIIPP